MQKAQSAVEFIVTYSWALLIIATAIAVAAVLAFLQSPSRYTGSVCNITPLLPCQETLLSSNAVQTTFIVLFNNNLGAPINLTAPQITLTTTNIGMPGVSNSVGTCSPGLAPDGAQVICTVPITGALKPRFGAQTTTRFLLNYKICSSLYSCSNTIYITTGLSLQEVVSTNINVYNVVVTTNTPNGLVVLGGVAYPNNAALYLLTGNYVMFAVPPQGYRFKSWQIAASTSTLSSTTTQNTVLTVSSNAVVTANIIP